MKRPPYVVKLEEATFNLNDVAVRFRNGDRGLRHSINNFLGSAQSVFWMLNKAFSKKQGYGEWLAGRSDRLPANGRTFKELRNISLKEEPIENTGMVVGYDVVGGLPAHATFEGHWVDTHTGRLKGEPRVISKEGEVLDLEIVVLHDFSVTVVSDGKEFGLETFLVSAQEYLQALRTEASETVRRFA